MADYTSNDFKQGFVLGMAMNPLLVTTEKAEAVTEAAGFVRGFVQIGGILEIFRVAGESAE